MIELRGFDWDDDCDVDGNSWHILVEHGHRNITQRDVESVFDRDPLILQEKSQGENPFYTVIGRDRRGRLLEVHGIYFQDPPKKFWFRPVTAFLCRKRLKERYFKSGRT